MTRRTACVALAVAASVALVAHALSRHPQGDIARIEPHVVAGLAVWSLVVAALVGVRRGVITALVGGALFTTAVAAYIVFLRPIPYDECGYLFQELSREPCRAHGSVGWIALLGVAALVSAAVAVSLTRGPGPRSRLRRRP